MKTVKQTYTPTPLPDSGNPPLSKGLIVYGILFIAWVFVQVMA